MTIRLFLVLLSSLCLTSGHAQRHGAEKIYRKVSNSVVGVYSYHDLQNPLGQGSGVIIKDKGWLVTNNHILGQADSLYAKHNGQFIPLDSLIAVDVARDILILRIAMKPGEKDYKYLPGLTLGDSDKLRMGEQIYAIGNPFGLENTISDGIVSGLRKMPENGLEFIQISAPISSGSSGGAVVNAKGQLIGISTLIFTGATAQNLNFAVPVNDVVDVARGIISAADTNLRLLNSYYQEGLYLAGKQDYDGAIEKYNTALKHLKGREADILYFNLGLAYAKILESDSAIFYLEKSVNSAKGAESLFYIGEMYFSQKNYPVAAKYYEKALQKAPGFTTAQLKLATSYFGMANYAKVVFTIVNMSQEDQMSEPAMLLLARVSLNSKMYDSALETLYQVTRRYPANPYTYELMAQAYDAQGDHENRDICKGIAEKLKAAR